jgi:ABC-type Fe3+ transport system substrate-binding protein
MPSRKLKEQNARCIAQALAFCLLACTFGSGCGTQGPESVRLTLISPHRDEIRAEVGPAFRDWFQERTTHRVTAARVAIREALTRDAVDKGATVRRAFADLFQDWRTDDMTELQEAYRRWQEQPTREHGQTLVEALDRWHSQWPGIELVWQDIGGGTSQIARYVGARFESNPAGIGIDVLFGGGTDIFLRFASQGLLARLALPASLFDQRIRPQLNGLPLYDPEGRWFGPMLTSFGILHNRAVLERIGQPVPARWADLGAPGLYGWVSAGDPRLTGSLHMVYEIILQGLGWEEGFRLLLRLGANTHSFIRDSGTLTRTVANGEVGAAGNLDANALTAVGRNPETIGFRLPPGETIINPDAVAVLKGAPRKELARAFVEFTLSDAGQLLFLLQPGQAGGPRRYPLCRLSVVEALYARSPPEVRSVGVANPFQAGKTISYDGKLGNSRWDALNDLFGAAIIDAHPDLAAAWGTLLRLPEAERQPLEADLFAPPCRQEELMAHARAILEESPRVRTATINRWGEEARQRYRRIRRSAESR